MNKPADCYKCKYRGTVPGSCHSSCLHPKVKNIHSNPLAVLAGIMGGAIFDMDNTLNVKGKQRGIEKGWFAWPINFDPIWLQSCDGFTAKEKETK